ncbi:MAG: hypothetical protein IKI38_04910 [Mogibacterium sp.]|nr:hypothetical protein [Mogibacterium sp.]
MTPEDIGDIFQALEDALFDMAIKTMKHHENWEQEEGFQWTQWQAEQIQGLRAYRQNVTALTDYYFTLAKQGIEAYLRQAYRNSVDDAAETARTIMMQTGRLARFSQQFFGVNSKKLDVLINEAIQNIDTKRYAAINRMNTGYTDMLRKADIFAQSGSFTIPQAVDMAAKDFLSAGLNCVEYSNGNRVNIASYAEMALRTSSSEVTRQANGDVRDELGEYLVVSNVIGITCPICQKWQGKVLIDDVYASGKPDGKHKLVSQAKAAGFMHPNCRHQLYMYIPGLTEIADLPDTKITRERYKAEQQQRYQERQIRKYKRLRDGAVDPANRKRYDARVKEWTERHDKFLESRDYLRKNPKRLAPGYTGNGKPVVSYEGFPKGWTRLGEVKPDQVLGGCNPNWNPDLPTYLIGTTDDYSTNCTNCVVAYDLRSKGFNVTANSTGACGALRTKMFSAWVGREPSKVEGNPYYYILDYFNRNNECVRVAVGANRPKSIFDKTISGHAFVMERRDNQVVLIDAQSGRIYNKVETIIEYFRQFDPSSIEFMRIDDLQISDRGISACKAV